MPEEEFEKWLEKEGSKVRSVAILSLWINTGTKFAFFLEQGYTHFQLTNLVQIWPGTKDKKTRARFLKIVDEIFDQ